MNRPAWVRRAPSPTESHQRWLQLVDADGPFLSIPVLKNKKVYPQGIGPLEPRQLGELKAAKEPFEKVWDRWSVQSVTLEEYREARDIWVDVILRRVFGWGDHYALDDAVTVSSPTQKVSVSSTGVLRRKGEIFALVLVVDPVRSLRDVSDDGWATNTIDRMELLLREAGVAIGVVTDGRWWAIVNAQPKITAASGITDSQTWIEEPATRDAFAELLSPGRLFGGNPDWRLPMLFKKSVTAAEDITEALGSQVRRAIELLVHSFSETAEEARRKGEPNPLPQDGDEIYSAAVTVMMRVVFLLFAEERDLLPQGELFDQGYGLTGQLDALRRRAEEETHEALDATSSVWHRLMATSRALFGGASFENMRLPAYGGSLFDPNRFPFLSGLTQHGSLALPVDDRVMMQVLDAVQMADVKGEGRRPISFRDIDVEQIGYIYEGLLGYTCSYATEVVIGLVGKKGMEPEIPLRVLNDFADEHDDDKAIAGAILKWVKEYQPAASPPTLAALTKALEASDTVDDAELAIRSITHDLELAAELRSWMGAIRRDLRDRPTVIKQGGLYVRETPSRQNAGAHYTPRTLAEEVVHHALEPLVHSPGPYQTSDPTQWVLKSPEEILDLKVADIACGSGAFLVAAARYLAARLVEAWTETGTAIGTPETLETDAIRQVVSHCLYGADINPMAIEMCKLSLWLVSLDPKLPFSFVDDKVLVGNSLLGITDLAQLEALHIDPTRAPAQPLFDVTSSKFGSAVDVRGAITRAARIRGALATEVDNNDPQRSAQAKRGQLERLHETTAQLRDVADGVIAAGLRLGGKPGKALDEAYDNLRIAVNDAYPSHGEPDRTFLDSIQTAGLTPTVDTDYKRWEPLHWAIELADVFERGGFDAIVGNPPFLSGNSITSSAGKNLREWLVCQLAGGEKGKADQTAYFLLRSFECLAPGGTLGLIASKTIAQNESRIVGLKQLIGRGLVITGSVRSESWPTKSASTDYSIIWGTVAVLPRSFRPVADGMAVSLIDSFLEGMVDMKAEASALSENRELGFIGAYVNGSGFTVSEKQAVDWISEHPETSEVLKPYLGGTDLNQHPDLRTRRWVIDFGRMTEVEASRYGVCFNWVLSKEKKRRGALKGKPRVSDFWWQYEAPAVGLYRALERQHETLAMARVSKTLVPVRVSTEQILNEKLMVFASDSYSLEAVLSSSAHLCWALLNATTRTKDPTYVPRAFLSFPRPPDSAVLNEIGHSMDGTRREIMLRRGLGLTKLYNLINDPDIPSVSDPDVARMREILTELDHVVMAAYGWDDVTLDHGFHSYRQMTRWMVSPEARVEILDRLLEENHRRAALQDGNLSAVDEDEETNV